MMVGSVRRGYETPTMLSQHRRFKSGCSGNSCNRCRGERKQGASTKSKMIKSEIQSDAIIRLRQQEKLKNLCFSSTCANTVQYSVIKILHLTRHFCETLTKCTKSVKSAPSEGKPLRESLIMYAGTLVLVEVELTQLHDNDFTAV